LPFATLAVAVLAALGTAVIFSLPEPERGAAASADGGLRVEGTWMTSRAPEVFDAGIAGPFTAVRGTVYRLSAPPAPSGAPYLLSFALPVGLDPARAALYRFDPALAAWRSMPAVRSEDGWTLRAEAMALPSALWAVGEAMPARDMPASPIAMRALEELLDAPPPDAVGFRVARLWASVEDDFVVVEEAAASGGCGGTYALGTGTVRTSVDVNEVGGQTRLVADWRVEDGCAPGVDLEPAVPPADML